MILDAKGEWVAVWGVGPNDRPRLIVPTPLSQVSNIALLLSSIAEPVIVHDDERTISYANVATERLVGKPRSEIIGRDCFEVFPGGLCGSECQFCGDKEGALRPRSVKSTVVDPTGTKRDVIVGIMPLWDEQGQKLGALVRVLGADGQPTGRAPALAMAEDLYRTAFEQAGDAIFIFRVGGTFLEVNEVACARLGYTRDELLRMSPLQTSRTNETGLSANIAKIRREGSSLIEITHVTKDGIEIPTELSSRAISYLGLPAVLSFARDITARKRVEAQLRQSERRFSSVLAQLPHGVIVHDQGRIRYANNALATLLGYDSPSTLIDRELQDLIGPGPSSAIRMPSAGDKDTAKPYPAIFVHRDKTTVATDVTTIEIDFEGRPAMMTVVQDSTEVVVLRRSLLRERSFRGIVGRHHTMQEVFQTIREVAPTDVSVCISGETGTGKELVASAIHYESERKNGAFVPVNCGALPEGMLESELFGHVRGAFTGAYRDKKGRFELAHNGTLFLDEVGELAPSMQVKLLRALQEKRVQPVGAERSVAANVRVISATNRDLKALLRKHVFREDLYFRLCVVPIHLPPLRDRGADVILLAEELLGVLAAELKRPAPQLSDDVRRLLLDWKWPGNVRELGNVLQFALVKTRGNTIEAEHLPKGIAPPDQSRASGQAGRHRKLTSAQVEAALRETGGNKAKAARLLGVGRSTVYRYVEDMD